MIEPMVKRATKLIPTVSRLRLMAIPTLFFAYFRCKVDFVRQAILLDADFKQPRTHHGEINCRYGIAAWRISRRFDPGHIRIVRWPMATGHPMVVVRHPSRDMDASVIKGLVIAHDGQGQGLVCSAVVSQRSVYRLNCDL